MGLEIDRLTLRFGGIKALNDISFKAEGDELVAIVGPNGAGKTALLNTISGIYRPTSGAIRLDGKTLTGLPVHQVAATGIGRAFQHAELFPHMTVTENLLVGRHLRMRTGLVSGALYMGRARREEKRERARIEAIIDFFEIYRYRDAVVANLPYGAQKLVGVARALALEPRVLLLDEPSTGLMREEKENFARFLLRMRHEMKITMLWVEHDMQMVSDLADRIVVLNYGQIIAAGPPDVVRRDPQVIAAYIGG